MIQSTTVRLLERGQKKKERRQRQAPTFNWDSLLRWKDVQTLEKTA